MRPTWDEYFLALCHQVATRSVDTDTQVGCVIVNEHHRVVSTGYNSFPAGVNDSFWPRTRGQAVKVPWVGAGPNWFMDGQYYEVDKYSVMTHAEKNAIVSAGQPLHGCTLFTLLYPCHDCAQMIITAGIRTVIYRSTREDASWAVAKELLRQAGVECFIRPEVPLED